MVSSEMTLDKLVALLIAIVAWLAAGVSVVYHFWRKYSERASTNFTEFVETAPGQWRRVRVTPAVRHEEMHTEP